MIQRRRRQVSYPMNGACEENPPGMPVGSLIPDRRMILLSQDTNSSIWLHEVSQEKQLYHRVQMRILKGPPDDIRLQGSGSLPNGISEGILPV